MMNRQRQLCKSRRIFFFNNRNFVLQSRQLSSHYNRNQVARFNDMVETFEAISVETSRNSKIATLSQLLHCVVEHGSSKDVSSALFLSSGQLAPTHEGIEIGIGNVSLIKAIASVSKKSTDSIKELIQRNGDLGKAVKALAIDIHHHKTRENTKSIHQVHESLLALADVKGKGSLALKLRMIEDILLDCSTMDQMVYIIRLLKGEGLGIGISQKSVLSAFTLALARGNGVFVNTTPTSCSSKEIVHDQDIVPLLPRLECVVQEAFSVCSSLQVLSNSLLDYSKRLSHLPKYEKARILIQQLPELCKVTPGIPVQPMLAIAASSVQECVDRIAKWGAGDVTCEGKYDGERVQIHMWISSIGSTFPKDVQVRVFSRNTESVDSKYPSVLPIVQDAARNSIVESFIMDAEIVAYDDKQHTILPFQQLSTSPSTRLYVFDLLYLNGESLIHETLEKRRQFLKQTFSINSSFRFVESINVSYSDITNGLHLSKIKNFFQHSLDSGCEGLILKTLNKKAEYLCGKRSLTWLKLKGDYVMSSNDDLIPAKMQQNKPQQRQILSDSLDLVPIGGYWGKGKRHGCIGAFLMACYNSHLHTYQSVCKVGTGFSDQVLENLSNRLLESKSLKTQEIDQRSFGTPDVWFEPREVWEIRGANLTLSPTYEAARGHPSLPQNKGISLRFPRFLRYRNDKSPEQATTAEEIVQIYTYLVDHSTKALKE